MNIPVYSLSKRPIIIEAGNAAWQNQVFRKVPTAIAIWEQIHPSLSLRSCSRMVIFLTKTSQNFAVP